MDAAPAVPGRPREVTGRVVELVPLDVPAADTDVKIDGLPRSLFTRTGPPRLAVISCGGTFDRAKRSYRDNVVVIAEPVTR